MPRRLSAGRWLAAVAFCAAVSLPAAVQAADQEQLWIGIGTNGKLGQNEESPWRYWFDAHARSQDDYQKLGVSIVRPAIGYQVSDNLTLWAGYGRIVARRPGPDEKENRIWQQATYTVAEVFGGKLTGRTRLEQRLIEGFDDEGHRLRQFFRWSRPIAGGAWSWLLANETFIAFNDTDFGQRSGYLQNRAYLGFAWQIDRSARLEIAYLNNHIDRGRLSSLSNDNLSLALFF